MSRETSRERIISRKLGTEAQRSRGSRQRQGAQLVKRKVQSSLHIEKNPRQKIVLPGKDTAEKTKGDIVES